ncbi:MAG TPA: hypothetical protein DCL61_07560, partial [Cyanobacteria bacterium UBA12227]|nr:hypothetical protein [Cyanobacteria bacterium UBA12227]
FLSEYVRCTDQEGHQDQFYLKRLKLRIGRKTKKVLSVKKMSVPYNKSIISAQGMKIEVEIAGKGMIGRVARVRINNGKDLAFKAFFDPNFVWQHGPWAEIPIGIRLKYCQVTKDMPEFLFAGQDWAVWEWIYPHTNPQSRVGGITYEQFAKQEGLTRLNPLNISNYNPHNMRLDPGGIQKDYLGRRFHDLLWSILFYLRKTRREGLKSLTPYLTQKMIGYMVLRLVSLINPGISSTTIKPKETKVGTKF